MTPPEHRHHVGATIIIAMLGMIGPFTIDSMFPAFAQIGREFSVDTVALQQLTSVYLVSFAVMSLFHGPISDAVGRKPVMITGLLVYALASVGAALAPSFGVLLVFRAMQGLSAGAGQIISRALIRDLFHGAAAQRLMAQVSMIFAISPALAPVVGGWILLVGNWRLTFWFLVAFGVLLCVLVRFGLPETHPHQRRVPLRVGTLLRGLAQVMGNRVFLRLGFASAFAFAAQFLYISAAPIFIVDLLGKGEQDFWIFFVPMIAGMMTGFFLNARLAERVPGRRLATIGYVVAISAGLVNVALSALPSAPQLPWAVVGPMLIAFGVALSFPVVNLVMLDLFPSLRGSAASGQSFMQLMLNAALAGLVVPMVTGSVLQLALAAACFSLAGFGMWVWHLRAVPADATAGQVVVA
ncbi:multidrug effflux MFS transporter [Aestuariimicrobium sp. T2.26MG-19.2B]|uniref:multidrug effflux MFS transporter n=1 Tax=Aestuariimicrobium sp. T2.26MG-19.2B TaxID=3040679 RepID=UPI00253F7B02|nr:multidrug effflux MFS transporter [Aestuariimicrobium sp. T2.26MG-19.2B]